MTEIEQSQSDAIAEDMVVDMNSMATIDAPASFISFVFAFMHFVEFDATAIGEGELEVALKIIEAGELGEDAKATFINMVRHVWNFAV